MYEVLVGATDDVLVSDSQRVDASSHALQHVDHLQRVQAPDLTEAHRQQQKLTVSTSFFIKFTPTLSSRLWPTICTYTGKLETHAPK